VYLWAEERQSAGGRNGERRMSTKPRGDTLNGHYSYNPGPTEAPEWLCFTWATLFRLGNAVGFNCKVFDTICRIIG
jgi:hypothetical protein